MDEGPGVDGERRADGEVDEEQLNAAEVDTMRQEDDDEEGEV